MKRLSVILMACLLVLGMSQCKKEKPNETNEEGVSISLKVIGDNAGSKVNVEPGESTAPVTYEDGDVIYVVSDGKYVGTLTRNSTSHTFTGDVTGAVVGKPFSFFFLGNKSVGTLTAGVSTSCTVDISDQTPGLPVISCGTSTENFMGVTASYTCQLNNQCALVKFDLGSVNTDAKITIKGVTNELTVNFDGTVTSTGTGNIDTYYGSGSTRYAVVAKDQADINGVVNADAYEGTYSIAGIGINGYVTCSMTLHAPHAYVDLGLPSKLLWATCNVGADTPEDYGDYFAWGETVTKSTYYWSNYQHCKGSSNTLTKYCNNSSYGYNSFTDNRTTLLPEDDAATANWGGKWRMPTKGEIEELYGSTTSTWTQQKGVYGRKFTASNGNSLFLPAAGLRSGDNLNSTGKYGYYWSSSLGTVGPDHAWNFLFRNGSNYFMYDNNRVNGFAVRPVRDADAH